MVFGVRVLTFNRLKLGDSDLHQLDTMTPHVSCQWRWERHDVQNWSDENSSRKRTNIATFKNRECEIDDGGVVDVGRRFKQLSQ